MLGVFASVLPKQEKSPQPRSSMSRKRMLGGRFGVAASNGAASRSAASSLASGRLIF